jgi:hypothetical protein
MKQFSQNNLNSCSLKFRDLILSNYSKVYHKLKNKLNEKYLFMTINIFFVMR